MKLPLHIDQEDYSKEANTKRAQLHIDMQQQTNGKGFRQPATRQNKKDYTRLTTLIKYSNII